MAFAIDPAAPVADEVRRVARGEVRKALADLRDPGADVVEAIHDCRKRCKKVRALVRLVRPTLGSHYPYRRGRKALATVSRAPSVEGFHEYRKRVKYTRYHVRLLSSVAPSVTVPLEARLHELSDWLGDDHDLAVLADHLGRDPERFGGVDAVDGARSVIDARRSELERRAITLGARLHAERTAAFTERVAAYWDAYLRYGPEGT